MMDYENIKAMIEARLKQFQAAGNTEAAKTCELILRDLDTFHEIIQAQEVK